MKSRLAILLVVVITVTALLVAGCAPKAEPAPAPAPTTAPTAAPTTTPTPAPEGETYKWRAQTLWDAGENVYVDFANWCASVGELSGGQLTIEPFPAGAIVSYDEAFDAVRQGMFEINGASYASGKDIAFNNAVAPFVLYENFLQQRIWYYRAGGKELMDKLYREWDLQNLGIHGWGNESMVFKDPVDTIEEFKGLKVRAPAGDVAKLMERLGADVATIPGPDVYLALSTGVIDAADWGSPSMNMSKGFFEVANYYSLPGYHSAGRSSASINAEAYDALPADLQAILLSTFAKYDLDQTLTATYEDYIAIAEMAKIGVYGLPGSPELVMKVREILIDIYNEDAQEGTMAKEFMDSHINFLTQIGLWGG